MDFKALYCRLIHIYDLAYCFIQESIDSTPLFLPASLTFLITLFAAILAFITLKNNAYFARSKNAIDFEKSVEDSLAYRNFVSSLLSYKCQTNADPTAIASLAADASLDREAYLAAKEILNLWERCGNGIRCGVYNEKVLRRVYRNHLVNVLSYLTPFINKTRTRKDNPYVYREASWLAKKWASSKKKEDFIRKITFRN